MATINKFLEAYKNLETEIRNLNPNDTVYDYENRLSQTDPQKAEKLKVCRINRNFIQHNPDSAKFVGLISDKWIDFLEAETNIIHSKNDLMKKHIYKATPVDAKTSIKDAITIVASSKVDVVPVVSKGEFVGLITPKQVLVAYMKSSRTAEKLLDYISDKTMKNVTADYDFSKPTDRYIDYSTKPNVVITSDGTSNGLYIGLKK